MTTVVRPAVRIEDGLLIPAEAGTLEGFTRWALSEAFPETGRIDFLQGTVEVDMSPEDLQTHGKPKSTLHAYIERIVAAADLGEVYVDRASLRSTEVDLTCEPDVLFVSWESLESGRARHVRSALQEPGRFLQIEGAADLVVEVVSDGSVEKDTERLPPLYARAGVRELWLVDARGPELSFEILHLHGGRYRRAQPDAGGYRQSKVLGRRVRLRREPGRLPETWRYFVDES
jgi:Uma2 family endonuclease